MGIPSILASTGLYHSLNKHFQEIAVWWAEWAQASYILFCSGVTSSELES